jgi:hypothetical protein
MRTDYLESDPQPRAPSSCISRCLRACALMAYVALSACGGSTSGPADTASAVAAGPPAVSGPTAPGPVGISPGFKIAVTPDRVAAGAGSFKLGVSGPMYPRPQITVNWNSFRTGWQTGSVVTWLSGGSTDGTHVYYTVPSELTATCGSAQVFVELFDHVEGTTWGRSASVPVMIGCASAQPAAAKATPIAAQSALAVANFSNIDFPGASQTLANDVNGSGAIVGRYDDAVGFHGFLLIDGQFTTMDFPGANGTSCLGINEAGTIVGRFSRAGVDHGFIYRNGTYTQIDVPGSLSTQGHGINLAGQIVGRYFNTENAGAGGGYGLQREHGYLLAGGHYTSLDFPDGKTTDAWRITEAGTIVGDWSSNGSVGSGSLQSGAVHGYILQGGEYTNLDFPNSRLTSVRGINALGQVAGIYWDQHFGEHAFIGYAGDYLGFDYPGAVLTDASAINDSGTVVGVYQDAQGLAHGFSARFTSR